MLSRLGKKFPIESIIEQTLSLDLDKRLAINSTENYLFSGPYHVKPEFVGTPIGMLLDSLGEIGEARLLRLRPEESYMAHSDPDDRIHLAIVTNPFSYLIDLDDARMYHIPVDGDIWHMDTGKRHVAANFGSRDRIHLNIRCLLPDVQKVCFHYKIVGGDFDDRHIIQANISTFLNREIKNKNILGIRKVNDREILINFKNENTKNELENLIIRIGLNFEIFQTTSV